MDKTKEISELIDKAARAESSEDALRFAEAAERASYAQASVAVADETRAETKRKTKPRRR